MIKRYSISPYQKYIDYLIAGLIIFTIWNFKWEANFTFISCQILWLSYLTFILFLLKSKSLVYIYEPPIYFLLFSFIYELPKFHYIFKLIEINQFLVDNYLGNPVLKVGDYYASSCAMYIFQFLCISCLFLSYNFYNKKKIINNNVSFSIERPQAIVYFIIVLLVTATISLYTTTNGNIYLYLARRSGNLEDTEFLENVSYLFNLSSKLPLILLPVAISLYVRLNFKWNYLTWFFLPAAILSYLMSGVRGNIIYSLIAILLLLFLFKKIKFSLTKSVLIGITIILAFGFFGTLRRSFFDTDNIAFNSKITENKEWYYELSGYQLQLRDEMVHEYATKVGLLNGSSYLNILFFPVPKSIVGKYKPIFLDKTVAIKFWRMDWTALPLNAMGEAYYNFGYAGIFVFIIIGSIMASWTNWLTKNPFTMYISFSIVILIFLQALSSTYIVYCLQYSLISMLLFSVMKVHKFKTGYVSSTNTVSLNE